MRDHRKLEVFGLADSLALAIYKATKSFPNDERYGLTSQLRRAAVSVGTNIVEGAALRSKAEFLHMLTIAHASACEVEYELSLALRLGYLDKGNATQVMSLATRTCRGLNRLISAVAADVSGAAR